MPFLKPVSLSLLAVTLRALLGGFRAVWGIPSAELQLQHCFAFDCCPLIGLEFQRCVLQHGESAPRHGIVHFVSLWAVREGRST